MIQYCCKIYLWVLSWFSSFCVISQFYFVIPTYIDSSTLAYRESLHPCKLLFWTSSLWIQSDAPFLLWTSRLRIWLTGWLNGWKVVVFSSLESILLINQLIFKRKTAPHATMNQDFIQRLDFHFTTCSPFLWFLHSNKRRVIV